MTATTAPPETPLPGTGRLVRFSGVTRAVHWLTAALVFVLLGTAAALYLPSVAAWVGRRETVKNIHVWAGLVLPIPLFAGLALSRRAPTLGDDLCRLGRWDRADGRWLRSFGRDPSAAGKFNAGQKLFAVFVAATLPALLMTGVIMRWFSPFPLLWRTGATFVHDWTGLALAVAVTGHILKAVTDPAALAAMFRGWVPADWARRHRARWHAELSGGYASVPEPAPVSRPHRRRQWAIALGVATLAVAGGAYVGRETGGARSRSPGEVAVAWEEAVDRADYAGLFGLVTARYRSGLTRDELVAREAAALLDLADVKGGVVGVSVRREKVEGNTAAVVLDLTFADGLVAPQTVGLRRETSVWRVDAYTSITQTDLIAACLRAKVARRCLG